ncbi:phage/plasmid primase, P4 family [Desulforhabdus sp. TSK]|uniref:DNA primase family protein n=1 Tax=Desulforhabdus sp. TSK TaxID=2925014 RepID=UPI001FC8617B|nr:DNA primase family protein [Desulforhabdus sp. TSK]GKT10538.1 hypothetical protein DSTSK_38430 [Desulforhabdus sp. TSK]
MDMNNSQLSQDSSSDSIGNLETPLDCSLKDPNCAEKAIAPDDPDRMTAIRVEAAKIIEMEQTKFAPFEELATKDSKPKFKRSELIERIEGTSDFEELTGTIARDVTQSGLPDTHVLSLRKSIAKKAGVSVASLVEDAKKINQLIEMAVSSEDDHLPVARAVVESYGAQNIIDTPYGTWLWDESGIWKLLDPRQMKKRIHELATSLELTRNKVDSILDLTKTEVFRAGHEFDAAKNAINVLNGEIHWNGKNWELQSHRRDHYRTTQLPIRYDPLAKAPRFEQFLREVFIKDADRVLKARLICEMIGYCLLSSCEYEKFFLLIGPGANGKSVLMETIAALVGGRHVSAVQPSQFENRFQRAHLHGKLVNLVTEIAEGHEIADAQLKAIVSGELTTAEHKHKPPFDFTPFCTCIFGTNHMPHTRDFSDALFRRAIIITFNGKFSEPEQDRHLKSKLKLELPGILNLALQAIGEVFLRGEFTRKPSSEEAKKEWRLDCDQVAQFVEENCEIRSGLQVASQQIYSRYERWASDAGVKKLLNRKNFTTRLVRLGAELTRGTLGTRMIAGIALK